MLRTARTPLWSCQPPPCCFQPLPAMHLRALQAAAVKAGVVQEAGELAGLADAFLAVRALVLLQCCASRFTYAPACTLASRQRAPVPALRTQPFPYWHIDPEERPCVCCRTQNLQQHTSSWQMGAPCFEMQPRRQATGRGCSTLTLRSLHTRRRASCHMSLESCAHRAGL